jgi:hypothetical protein
MSLPVATTNCGMQAREEMRGMARIARGFRPLTAADVEPLLAAARGAARDGHIEEYKDPKSGYGCSYQDAVLKGGRRRAGRGGGAGCRSLYLAAKMAYTLAAC